MKLDQKEIERLVEEALNEISVSVTGKDEKQIAKDLGLSVVDSLGDYLDFAKTAPPKDVIDDKDIDKALKYRPNSGTYGKRKQMAQKIANNPAKGLSDAEKWEYDLSSIPQNLKDVILLAFKNITGTDDAKLKKVAQVAESVMTEDRSKLEWEDFATILKNPNHPLIRQAVMAVRIASNALDDTDDHRKSLEKISKNLGYKLQPAQIGSDKQSSVPSVDVADAYGQARTEVPAYVVSFFNNLQLQGVTSVKQRIESINNFTKNIMEGKYKKGDSTMGELISNVAVMGLMARIAKLMDDKAAGWAFESWLAQLVNGTTEGANMGAADFIYGMAEGTAFPPGAKGSAKLISSDAFTQSKGTLGDALKSGESLYYIVGKKLDDAQSPTAKTAEIAAVEIHLVETKRTKGKIGDPVEPKDMSYGPVGSATTAATTSSTGSVKFKISSTTTKIGTVYFNKDLDEIDKASKAAMEKIDTELPALFERMNGFKNRTNEYLSSGRTDAGTKALEDYKALFNAINKVFGIKRQEAGGKELGLKGSVDLKENKLSVLDKLILEVLKENT